MDTAINLESVNTNLSSSLISSPSPSSAAKPSTPVSSPAAKPLPTYKTTIETEADEWREKMFSDKFVKGIKANNEYIIHNDKVYCNLCLEHRDPYNPQIRVVTCFNVTRIIIYCDYEDHLLESHNMYFEDRKREAKKMTRFLLSIK